MKIAVVALNPAIDQSVQLDRFRPGAVNRGKSMRTDPGGKGVNVACFLSNYLTSRLSTLPSEGALSLTSRIAITGFFGIENFAPFELRFAEKGIQDYSIRIPGHTRTSIKINDAARQQTTDINLPGLCPSSENLEHLYRTILELARDHAWFVLTGSLPPGVPPDLYARLIDTLHQRGCRVLLDTSGQALREGIRAQPEIIKPNRAELEELNSTPLAGLRAVQRVARRLIPENAGMVVVSLGKQGAIFVDANTALLAVPPAVQIRSTVGAGDAVVAGILSAQLDGLDLAACARRAIAFSVGAISQPDRGLPDSAAVDRLSGEVRIRAIKP